MAVERRGNGSEDSARGCPRAPSPSPPRDEPRRPHVRTARRTGRSARLHGAAPGEVGLLTSWHSSRERGRHLDVALRDGAAGALHDHRARRCFVGRSRSACEAAARDAECSDAERRGADQDPPTTSPDLACTIRHCFPFREQATGPPERFCVPDWGRFRSGSPQAQATNSALADRCLPVRWLVLRDPCACWCLLGGLPALLQAVAIQPQRVRSGQAARRESGGGRIRSGLWIH